MAGRWRSRALIASAIALATACGDGRGSPPPSPTTSFEPTVVSLIATVDGNWTEHRVVLENGTKLTLRSDSSSTQLSNGRGPVGPGDLVLAGAGNPPAWWAALESRRRIRPSGASGSADLPDGLCWTIYGGAFDERDSIQFSTGLRLRKAAEFHVQMTWIKDPFPARDGDSFCVNRAGAVTSLEFIWVGGY